MLKLVEDLNYITIMKIKSNLAISEDGFVFNPKTGESFTANEVGVAIMHELNAGTTTEEIISKLSEEYDVDTYTLEKSVHDFLLMMQDFNLVDHV